MLRNIVPNQEHIFPCYNSVVLNQVAVQKTYLVTGGTGFLGSRLAVYLLKRGSKIVFVGRPRNGISFDLRIRNVLFQTDETVDFSLVHTIEGDTTKEKLGISDELIRKMNGSIHGIWHLAADLSFKPEDKKKVFTTNTYALKNILKVGEMLKSPVYFTSTAYVHGKYNGMAYEHHSEKPKRFNNFYEESKYIAEEMLQDWGKRNGNNFIIFRLSILIQQKYRNLSFFGFYSFVGALFNLKKNMLKYVRRHNLFTKLLGVGFSGDNLSCPIPFLYCKKSILNLMPVERAIDWITKISEDRGALNNIFHITNPKPFSMQKITNETFRALHFNLIIISASRTLTSIYYQALFLLGFCLKGLRPLSKRVSTYKNYMLGSVLYDMTNTKKVLGEEIISGLALDEEFLYTVIKDFLTKLNEKLPINFDI